MRGQSFVLSVELSSPLNNSTSFTLCYLASSKSFSNSEIVLVVIVPLLYDAICYVDY